MKKQTTRRALLLSVLSLVLCVSMLTGTTFAWFTDSVTSANNVIVAGNLDVELYYQAEGQTDWTKVTASTNVFKENTLWEPGHTEVVKLKVVNEGTLALKYQLGVNVASEVGSTNVKGDPFLLSQYIKYGIAADGDYTRDTAIAAVGTANLLNVAYASEYIELLPADDTTTTDVNEKEHIVTLVVYMPTEVGNEANALTGQPAPTINLGINVMATQLAYEEDSFDENYDAEATLLVTNASELAAAIEGGKSVTLSKNITLDSTLVIPAAASTFSLRATPAQVIDLNGKTITGEMHKNDGAVINNLGNVVIKNGTIESTAENGGSAIANAGTIVVENATLKGAPNANGSWPSYTVNNTGVMTLNNCYITSFHGSVASYNEGAVVTLNNTDINMTGIKGFTNHGIYTYSNGKVIVNGGTITNHADDQASTGGSVINGAVEVNGGTFTGRVENYYGTPVIKGGTFTVKPNAKFIPEGYKIVDNADGTYYVDYVRTGRVYSAFTSTDSIWGEWGGNAKESFVIKIYSGNTFLGSASLNNVDGIIDGDVNVTWGVYLDTEAHQDEYWNQVWKVAPSLTLQPTHAALEVDGEEVGRSAIQLNGPDGVWAIDSAIVTDDEAQTIVSYVLKGTTVEAPEGCKIVKLK